jgi:hypothetical protein
MTARSVLPPSLAPRGLSREMAAEYIGVSPSKFDQLVRDGRMPPPKSVDRRKVWDLVALDLAFSALGESEQDLTDWDVKQK